MSIIVYAHNTHLVFSNNIFAQNIATRATCAVFMGSNFIVYMFNNNMINNFAAKMSQSQISSVSLSTPGLGIGMGIFTTIVGNNLISCNETFLDNFAAMIGFFIELFIFE